MSQAPRGFFASFRSSHWALKLSFSVVVALVLLGTAELAAGAYLARAYPRSDGPKQIYNTVISGYRVFKLAPTFDHGTGILSSERVVTDRHGFFCDHEVKLEKPAGTLRVFVTGGSAMAGAGQTTGYDRVHPYPMGAYGWNASIAGLLQEKLRAALPGRTVEVVSAAHNNKSFHQTVLHYLESLSRFAPDYVVGMDGYNDITNLTTDPYEEWERSWLERYVGLWNESHDVNHRTSLGTVATLFRQRLEARRAKVAAAPGEPYGEAALEAAWERERAGIVADSARWRQVFGHYLAALEADGTRLVYGIQPMVSRIGNKPLTPTEKGFHELAVPRGPAPVYRGFLVLRYFFDRVLAVELRKRIEERGQVYVDFGDSMKQDLDDRFELYTDYCHFTPEGNDYVARRFAQAIVADLARKR